MSFILDALKKSESDRQRQSGPALFEVKVAPPRTRLPRWAIAIAALLVINLGIVMWMLLRHPVRASAEGMAPATSASSAEGTAPAVSAPSINGTAGSAAGAPATAASLPPPARMGAAQSAPATPAATAPLSAGSAPAAPGAATGAEPAGTDASNPEDYAPAREGTASSTSAEFGSHVRRGTAAGVPLYQDAASKPGAQIPQLRLDLHAYAVRPQDRFVMINMHKLREGDSTPEGVHVETITPEGAVLSYNGSQFLLPRD
jgi:hypothetical protein